ncbi:MAG: glutamate formimidoyltransferase [Candidatus Marinimicrobia bacterium]|jgi:glutamate formiminotransferase/formiminotetrahydrofolate cyclodeaminase|nr:glutamate formimidoyltransferase [Candidatus Neomarinimicrobiota bacterium]|tara:strand:+ start:31310 stop:33007 length:1698 start_codon:yes stop_codon:yes gene_type:complete
MKLVECVPNFSEGRDAAKIKTITDAIAAVDGITLLDVDPGADTNRTVVTFVGEPKAVSEAAFLGIKTAAEVIDMSQQTGTHPRMGATDVCPFIPVSDVTDDECIELSKQVGQRVGDLLGIPVYLYEKSAQSKVRVKLPDIRKGEYEGLVEKLKDPNWKPDFGPAKLHVKAGATVMGCREFLIAYNINLNTKDHRLATDIAFELREAGRSKRTPNPNSKNLLDGEIVRNDDGSSVKVPGMFKDVKGIGWYVDAFNRAQISINFNNYKVSTIHDVYDAACKLADERGIRVTGSELVGLIPLEAILMAGKHYLKKQNRSIGVPVADIVECAVQSLGLNDVTEFNPAEKIIDYAVQSGNRPLMSLVGKNFVEELSTNSPAPGGGSVSALAGSLGAALSSMVAALTHEKKEMLDSKPMMDEIGAEAQALKDRLAFLVDEDSHAFNKVLDANRMSAATDEEQAAKAAAVEAANKYAIDIPFETAEKCYRVMELAEVLVEKGNPNSVSDAGVAAAVALAGVRGATMNVLINLPGVDDKSYCDEKRNAVNEIIQKAEAKHSAVFEKTIGVINS